MGHDQPDEYDLIAIVHNLIAVSCLLWGTGPTKYKMQIQILVKAYSETQYGN